MKYTFVNKNKIIPQIIDFVTYDSAIEYLITNNNKDVYIVKIENEIIGSILFYYDNCLYELENNIIKKIKYNISKILNHTSLEIINNFINKTNMNINIIENNTNNITIDNNIDTSSCTSNPVIQIDDDKRKEVLQMCEDAMTLYNNELMNIKNIENELRNIENKIQVIKKKNNDTIIENINYTKNEFITYNKIKEKIVEDYDVPIMFTSKYNYIKHLCSISEESQSQINSTPLEYFNKIIEIDIDNILNNEVNLDNALCAFAEKYKKTSTKLNFKFNHDWDYLDDEVESNNNSMFG
jgi:hypothetical protein